MGLVTCQQQNYYFDTSVEEKTHAMIKAINVQLNVKFNSWKSSLLKDRKRQRKYIYICLLTFCEKNYQQ